MTLINVQTFAGISFTALGLLSIVIAALMKRGKLQPSWAWGPSASYAFWVGIGYLAWGLGNLSYLVVGSGLALTLTLAGMLAFLVTTLVARSRAKAG